MDKERTKFLYLRLGGKNDSFEEDYKFFSKSVIDELLMVCNRKDIPVKYSGVVDELIAYTMRMEELDLVIRNSSSQTEIENAAKVKAITVGDTRTEFTDGISTLTESTTIEKMNLNNKYISLRSNLIGKIRRLRC